MLISTISMTIQLGNTRYLNDNNNKENKTKSM